MDLKGKCVLLGVTGGIAAYKMANVASALRKLGADVEVIMTKNATQFITPITFETLTGHKCMVDTFDRDFKFEVTHISLAKKADVILVAPATANVIAKMAHGSVFRTIDRDKNSNLFLILFFRRCIILSVVGIFYI